MTRALGIIAEDVSDVEVINVLVGKIAKKRYVKHHFVGGGHGKIMAKCRDWSRDLRNRGCHLLILVHDLDEKNERVLRNDLTNALRPSPIDSHVIVIPVREIEAWLLADHDAIRVALKLKNLVKKIPTPEAISRPKEYLRDLVASRSSRKHVYVNTIHNTKIAQQCRIDRLARCESFRPMERFVRQHL